MHRSFQTANGRRALWALVFSTVAFVGAAGSDAASASAQDIHAPIASLPEDASSVQLPALAAPPERGEPIQSGIVIVDGKYLPPPYVVTRRGETLFVQNVRLDMEALTEVVSRGRFPRGDFLEELGSNQLQSRVEGLLIADGMLVQFSDGTIGWFRPESAYTILDALTSRSTPEEKLRQLMGGEYVMGDFTSTQWMSLIRSFKGSDELKERLASHWGGELYPPESPEDADPTSFFLIVGGMCLTVFSFGVVLTYRPPVNLQWKDLNPAPEAVQLVTRGAILIGALSVFDLLCTYLASPASSFWEMNPVGASLIDQPIALVVFKLLFTAVSIGILVRLRTYRGAQMACWWACLLLTLLSIRWVAFNSFFIS